MADYAALIAKWATLTATTVRGKIAEINAATAPGPNRDVRVSEVEAILLLNMAYVPLQVFSQESFGGTPTHDAGLMAAKNLFALVTSPNAPTLAMSDPITFAKVKAMGDALLAQEIAVAGSTGFTQDIHDALLALPNTTIAWWAANGLPGPVCENALKAAGLVTVEQLQAEGMQ